MIHVSNQSVRVNTKIEMKPHDAADAARLYGELEQKAREAVANAVIHEMGANNEIKLIKAATHGDYIQGETSLRLLFAINGVNHDITVKAKDFEVAMGRTIAQELFKQLVDKLDVYQRNTIMREIE